MNHIKGDWKVYTSQNNKYVKVVAGDKATNKNCAYTSYVIARIGPIGDGPIVTSTRLANAHRICQCVNNFDKLLEVCKFAIMPEAPFNPNQLEFANRIIEAIQERAKIAVFEAEKEQMMIAQGWTNEDYNKRGNMPLEKNLKKI